MDSQIATHNNWISSTLNSQILFDFDPCSRFFHWISSPFSLCWRFIFWLFVFALLFAFYVCVYWKPCLYIYFDVILYIHWFLLLISFMFFVLKRVVSRIRLNVYSKIYYFCFVSVYYSHNECHLVEFLNFMQFYFLESVFASFESIIF